jgi:hypothetical protein
VVFGCPVVAPVVGASADAGTVPNWGLAEIQFAGNSPAGTTGPPGIVVPPGTLNPRLARFITVPRSPVMDTGTVPDAPVPTPLK